MSFYRNKRKNGEDDFIDDRDTEEEDEDESSEEEKSTRKKKVAIKKSRKEEEDDESSDEEKITRKKKVASKKSRKEEKGGGKIDPETGITVCKISNVRKVVVRQFKGRILVDIREFYEKDGEMLPSRKGISLGLEQWKILCENLDKVDAAIEEMS